MQEYPRYSDNQITYIISWLSQKCCLSNQSSLARYLMFQAQQKVIIYLGRLSMLCSIHNKPLEYLNLNKYRERHLKCKDCNIEGKFMVIDVELERIKGKVNQKKCQRQRSKIKSNLDFNKGDTQSKTKIIQLVAQQQLFTLEIMMRLFAEDKKKIYQRIQKVKEDKIIPKLYLLQNHSLRQNTLFYKQILDKALIEPYTLSLSRKGWQNIKYFLREASIQTFLMEKEIIEANRLKECLGGLIRADEQTMLKMVEKFLQNEEKGSKGTETTNVSIQSKYRPINFRQNNPKANRRSNSFT